MILQSFLRTCLPPRSIRLVSLRDQIWWSGGFVTSRNLTHVLLPIGVFAQRFLAIGVFAHWGFRYSGFKNETIGGIQFVRRVEVPLLMEPDFSSRG